MAVVVPTVLPPLQWSDRDRQAEADEDEPVAVAEFDDELDIPDAVDR